MQTIEKNSPDWSAIKAAWVLGSPSIKALAKIHGISDTYIRKKAAKEEWPVRGSGAAIGREPPREPERTESADHQVSASVEAMANGDAKDLAKFGLAILWKLARELDANCDAGDFLRRIVEEETAGDPSPRRRQLLLRNLSLPTRLQAGRQLASAIATLTDAGPGKKEQANDAAKDVAEGAGSWGNLLDPYAGAAGKERAN